jgi:2-hydroxychromene-2-carboxylate isomerase
MGLKRWSRRLHLPIHLEPRFFPVADADAALSILAARERGADTWAVARAFMAAVWQQQRDIADPATRRAILGELGLDAEALERDAAGLADRRAEESEQAIARGVFGAPTFVFEDALFWGQDRLDFLEAAVTR